MTPDVECHSGFAYPERPVAMQWQGRRLEIQSVLFSWRSPEAIHFRVHADDGQEYELAYYEADDDWHIQPN